MQVVYTYIHTDDFGEELRYSLRSLQNYKDVGKVFIVGDNELWVKNISFVPCKRTYGNPYEDVQYKLECIVESEIAEDFLLMMDDIYLTEEYQPKILHRGELVGNQKNWYQRSLKATREKLIKLGINPLNYETHAPFIVNKTKLVQCLEMIDFTNLQWRSIYGNIHQIGGQLFEDKKTKSNHLPAGDIISTQFYTKELAKLFPKESIYEDSVLR